jgi:hypothetical protein
MKKINLFIAKTPLQLFNCIEARNRFHKSEKNVLFYQYQRNIDKIQIENLIKEEEWLEVIAYPLSPLHRIFFQYFLNKNILKYTNRVDSCYFGAYNSIISYFINKVKPKEFFIIDDGVKTIKISELIKDGKLDKKGLVRGIKDKLMNSSRAYIYNAKFFTIYDEVEIFLPNRVIKNNYSAFKEHVSSINKENIIYFIGTNLLERSIKTEEIFEQELKKVVLHYKKKNQKLIYILHRYEDIDYLNTLSKEYDFEAVKFDNIIEVELLKRGTVPMGVASFASTAVETIKMIYGVDATIFELENSGIFEKYQEVFFKLYNNFREKGVDVVRL